MQDTEFSIATVIRLVREHYGLQVNVKKLNGYDELNYLLSETNSGEQYILKIAGEDHSPYFLDAQIRILKHLSESELSDRFQYCLINHSGNALTKFSVSENNYYLRVLNFLPGIFWADRTDKSAALEFSLGSFLGKMDHALAGFAHPAMHRHYYWDISTAIDASRKLQYITDHEKRRIAGYFLLQFETEVQPFLSSLRHAYAHNDANDYNLITKGEEVTGLIDFGDMVYTPLINNLAVAVTYSMLNNQEPLETACRVVAAYHGAYPLLAAEIDLLYYLIAARLCISVTQSAFNGSRDSENLHHFVTEKSAWDLLYKLIRINPVLARNRFRQACEFSDAPGNTDHTTLLQERSHHIGGNLSTGYRRKLKIVRGALQYLYDDQGNTYLDCVNNPSHVGHCHPVVVKKMQQQIATLNTNTRYLHDHLVEYAKRITGTLPDSLSVCYFTNSGSEANDLALRISRHYTRQKDIIVLDHAYHGTSTLAMEISPYKFDGPGGFGQMPYIHKAMNPDLYRGPFPYGDQEAGKKYARDIRQIILQLEKENKRPAAFICETLLGVGGQMPLPDGYLRQAYEYVRAAGGVCIADEVQVGFGRVGEKFWGFELQDVVPDMVVLGKPIGNGHPLAAVVLKREIADAFNNGMEYFNTFGGNTVSMAAGLAVLDVIQKEEMQKYALETGNHLMAGLKALMKKHPVIGDVRGHGLFIGAEMVTDRLTLQPAVAEINKLVELMRERGFLLSTDGPLHNVLKIKPPMTFNKENADELIKHLDQCLASL